MKSYFPEVKKVIDNDDIVARIDSKVNACVGAVSDWAEKQEKYYRMRQRIKKERNFPFKGASNLRMPTVDTNIRKIKAGIMNTVFGLRPIIQAIPTPSGTLEGANKVEKLMDHIIIDVMKMEPDAAIIVDRALEGGMYLAKPYWKRSICTRVVNVDIKDLEPEELSAILTAPLAEVLPYAFKRYDIDTSRIVVADNATAVAEAIEKIKSGEQKVKIEFKDVEYNAPAIAFVEPTKVFVPPSSGWNPQGCTFLCHEYFLPIDTLRYRAEERGWSKDGVNEIIAAGSIDLKDQSIDLTKDEREGITTLKDDGLVKIREFYGYEEIGNGEKEKVLVTYAPSFGVELRKFKWDMYTGRFPFVKFFYELTDDRWFSHRGIPELIEDVCNEIDTQHNIKIDQQTIRNAPMFVYRSGMVNPNMVQMRPNQAIPVKGTMALGDAVQALNFHNPSIEYSYEREQQLLESKIQELLGQPDYSLQSMINRREPRTLGEVQLQASAYSNIFGLDAKMFANSFSELFNMIFELWCMYGEDEYEFSYFGQNTSPERIKLTREELQNNYTLVVRGNDTNSNPNVRIQKAQQVLLAAKDPVLLQSGVVGIPQQVEALKEYYQALDIKNYDRFINTQPPPPSPPPVAAIVKPTFKDLRPLEQAQVVQSIGLKPEVEARHYDADRREATEEAKIAKEIVEMMGV